VERVMSFFDELEGLLKGFVFLLILGFITIVGGASLISPMFEDTEPTKTELR
jgi:hypothetical protein